MQEPFPDRVSQVIKWAYRYKDCFSPNRSVFSIQPVLKVYHKLITP